MEEKMERLLSYIIIAFGTVIRRGRDDVPVRDAAPLQYITEISQRAHKKHSLSNPRQEQKVTSGEDRDDPYPSTRTTGRDEMSLSKILQIRAGVNTKHTVSFSFYSWSMTRSEVTESVQRDIWALRVFFTHVPWLHSSSRKLGLPLETITWFKTSLLTSTWRSSSGPNEPGADSVRFMHWICTRRICVRVS